MRGGEKIRRAPGFIPRTIFFWLFMLFLYGPIAVIAILSPSRGRRAGSPSR